MRGTLWRSLMATVALMLLGGAAYAAATLAKDPNSNTLKGASNNPDNSWNHCNMEVQEWKDPPGQWITVSKVVKRNVRRSGSGMAPVSGDMNVHTEFTPTTPPALTGREFRLVVTWFIWTDTNSDGKQQETELSTQTPVETSSTYTYP